MKKKEKDIFDRIMDWKILSVFQPVYRKYKEVLLYLFFGGLTFLVSIGSYALFDYPLGFTPLVANIFSWIFAVAFAYVTNRIWVFTDVADQAKGVIREIVTFFAGRLATLGVEEVILYIGISVLGGNSILVKVIGQIVVIVSNYFISKIIVFRSKAQ